MRAQLKAQEGALKVKLATARRASTTEVANAKATVEAELHRKMAKELDKLSDSDELLKSLRARVVELEGVPLIAAHMHTCTATHICTWHCHGGGTQCLVNPFL